MSLQLLPLDLNEANHLVEKWHRHHKPVPGAKFAVGVLDVERLEIVGAAIVGRPVSRMLQASGWCLEVTRLVTDGTMNACSFLLGACRRAAFALGYRKLVTYTLPAEGGVSLRAAGWTCIGEAGGGSWSRTPRPRVDKAPLQRKFRWEVASVDTG